MACKDSARDTTLFQALNVGLEDWQIKPIQITPIGDDFLYQIKTINAVNDWHFIIALDLCWRISSASVHANSVSLPQGCQQEKINANGKLHGVWQHVLFLPNAQLKMDTMIFSLNNIKNQHPYRPTYGFSMPVLIGLMSVTCLLILSM
ncbi:MAG: hypothetical protein EXR35_07415 [Limnohabitans sp.]|nr:hypothetical protein [Limnohabitans sp.]